MPSTTTLLIDLKQYESERKILTQLIREIRSEIRKEEKRKLQQKIGR